MHTTSYGHKIGVQSPENLAHIEENSPSAPEDHAAFAAELQRLHELHVERTERSLDIATYSLPEIPDRAADDIYERILEGERIASRDLTQEGYRLGSADYEDHLDTRDGHTALVTAEHATFQKRTRDGMVSEKGPDWGTAGIAHVLQQDLRTGLILPRGMQTGDANDDAQSVLKDAATEMINSGDYRYGVSLHGIMSGLPPVDLGSERAFDIMLGIGGDTSDEGYEERRELARLFEQVAKIYDLKVGVDRWFTKMASKSNFTPTFDPVKKRPKQNRFAAGKQTMRGHMQQQGLPGVQVELSALLRVMPVDFEGRPKDIKKAKIAVYVGYMFVHDSVVLANNNLPNEGKGV